MLVLKNNIKNCSKVTVVAKIPRTSLFCAHTYQNCLTELKSCSSSIRRVLSQEFVFKGRKNSSQYCQLGKNICPPRYILLPCK